MIAFGSYGSAPMESARYSGSLRADNILHTKYVAQRGILHGQNFGVDLTIDNAGRMQWVSFIREGRGIATLTKQ